MKSDKFKLYIIEFTLIFFLLCFMFFTQFFNRIIMSIVLLLFMIITKTLIKSYKIKEKYNKKITSLMTIIGTVYISIMYLLGIYTGFYNSTVKLSVWSLINYIIPYIVIIVSTENIRKTIVLKEEKKSKIIILIATVIMDIILATNIYNLKSLTDYYMLIGFVMFSSIANNLLYNYLILKYRNSKAIILYRLITTLYVYIIPIIPSFHILFESITRIVVPYIIYLILESVYSKKNKQESTTTKTKDIVITSMLAFFTIIIIMLVSCQFKYGVLVIGSESMTGVLNKTDVVIYKELDENEKINIGDIIVFKQEGLRIIHRVIDKRDFGTGIKYFTKGDANPNEDEGYRVEADIIGKVKYRIPYIGVLAISLNEMFN